MYAAAARFMATLIDVGVSTSFMGETANSYGCIENYQLFFSNYFVSKLNKKKNIQ